MGIKETLLHGVAGLIIERPAKNKSLEQLAADLTESGAMIEGRASAAQDNAKATATLRHITGIERWSQNRLCVFLGAAYARDEYDSYQPGAALDLAGQISAFQETRAETIQLARQLQEADLQPGAVVEHNDFGPLSVRGWLAYINSHANREITRIK